MKKLIEYGEIIHNIETNEEAMFIGIESTNPNVAWIQKKDKNLAIVNIKSIRELNE